MLIQQCYRMLGSEHLTSARSLIASPDRKGEALSPHNADYFVLIFRRRPEAPAKGDREEGCLEETEQAWSHQGDHSD
jgi:hypothetical protein